MLTSSLIFQHSLIGAHYGYSSSLIPGRTCPQQSVRRKACGFHSTSESGRHGGHARTCGCATISEARDFSRIAKSSASPGFVCGKGKKGSRKNQSRRHPETATAHSGKRKASNESAPSPHSRGHAGTGTGGSVQERLEGQHPRLGFVRVGPVGPVHAHR